MTLPLHQQRDMTALALRINRQDIDELVRNCRWLVEYQKDRPDVFAEYLRVLRSFTEAQERALELGMETCPLAAPIEPLKIWNDDYRWGDVLARMAIAAESKLAALVAA